MTTLLMVFAMVLGAVVQAILPTWRWLGQAQSPILLGIVLYYSLAHTRGTMLQAAILGGLLQDALGMIPLGYSSFCFCVAGVMASKFKDMVFVHEMITHMLFGAMAAGLITLVLYGLLAKDDLVAMQGGWAVLKVFGSLLLGAIVVPAVFEVMGMLDRMLGNVEAGEA